MRFEDKRVIVTGGAAGFGEAICRRFAAEGAKVLVADIDVDAATKLADELPGALPFEADVTDEGQTTAMVAAAVDAWGGIDVLCANAGLPHRVKSMLKLSTEEFDFMWSVNVRSIWWATKAAVPHMPEGSSVVATASIGGRRPRPGGLAYNTSKAAAITLVKGMALELAPNIRVNCVTPVSAPTGFDMNAVGVAELPEEINQAVIAGIPMGRRAVPNDVAGAVAFLASDDAAFLTGVALDVDGGRSIS